MKLKKGDKVIIITGKDAGKTGVIARAYPSENRILVEGMNIKKKHQKAKRSGQKGQIVEMPMPFHASNAMLIDSKTGKGTRHRTT